MAIRRRGHASRCDEAAGGGREPRLLVGASPRSARAVTPLELFFDLVYVFTVSQLAHHLLDHVDARGMAETLVLTLAVMYAWFMTVWTSNWLDGDRQPVRLMLLGLMFASLLMSTSVSEAFGDRAGLFVVGYLAIQIGRTVFAVSPFAATASTRTSSTRWSGSSRPRRSGSPASRSTATPASRSGRWRADHLRRRDRRPPAARPQEPLQRRQPDLRRAPARALPPLLPDRPGGDRPDDRQRLRRPAGPGRPPAGPRRGLHRHGRPVVVLLPPRRGHRRRAPPRGPPTPPASSASATTP